jgi:hypothetical protein
VKTVTAQARDAQGHYQHGTMTFYTRASGFHGKATVHYGYSPKK